MVSSNEEFTRFLEFLKASLAKCCRVVFFSHQNMDPDAIGSIVALEPIVRKLARRHVNVEIFSSSLSKQAWNLLEYLNYTPRFTSEIPGKDAICIIVDAQSFPFNSGNGDDILDGDVLDSLKEKTLVIDHHVCDSEVMPFRGLIIPDMQSTAEVVLMLYKALDMGVEHPANFALAAGILFDSGFLKYGRNDIIYHLCEILRMGVDIGEVRKSIHTEMEHSEKIARLKAGQRALIEDVNGVLIVLSHVSSYESSACRALIGLGADIAVVIAEKKGQVRVSGRQSTRCFDKHGFNLASIFFKIGMMISGTGGGHEMAAAANGTSTGPGMMDGIMKILRQEIESSMRGETKWE